MIISKEEISNFLDKYFGTSDDVFSGTETELGKGKSAEVYTIFDQLLDLRIIAATSDKGGLDMILTDDNGLFYRYGRTDDGFDFSEIVPTVKDFK